MAFGPVPKRRTQISLVENECPSFRGDTNAALLMSIRDQSELDRRHQSAFKRKRFFIHHVPPARATDKKTQTKIGNNKN